MPHNADGDAARTPPPARLEWVDTLQVAVVAGVIGAHTATGLPTVAAFHPVPAVPEVTSVVVSAIGVVTCFAVGYAATRLPPVRKVL